MSGRNLYTIHRKEGGTKRRRLLYFTYEKHIITMTSTL